MKKLYQILILLFILQKGFAQTNTFPTSGPVGIGTTSPSYPLDIHGHTQRIYNATSAAYLRIEGTGLASYTGSYIILNSANTRTGDTFTKARIDANRGVDSTASFQISRMNGETYSGLFYRYDDIGGHRFLTAASRSATTTGEVFRITPEGHVGIGTSLLSNRGLGLSTPITGGTVAYGMLNNGTVKSDVTAGAYINYSQLNTPADATFTLPVVSHFSAAQGTVNSGTTITHQMGFWASSNLTSAANNYGFRGSLPASTGRWNLYMDGTASNYLGGKLGMGTTSLDLTNLGIALPLTGNASVYGLYNYGVIQSDVTGLASYFRTSANTQASAFTLPSLIHYGAFQGTLGASSTVTNQFGVFVDAGLTGATNNYGLYSAIPAGTGRWNLYLFGSANNYLAGRVGVGTTSLTDKNMGLSLPLTGTATNYGFLSNGTVQADVTSSARYFNTIANVAPSATMTDLIHFIAESNTFGAGSSVTHQSGFYVPSSLTGGTNNYAFRGNLAAATGRWNMYMGGTADNYFAGNVGIGTSAPSLKLEVVDANGIAFRHSQTANTAGTFRLMSGAYSGNKMTGVVFSTTNTLNNIALGGGTLLGEPANNLYFYTAPGVGSVAVGTSRMSIDSAGFVGIPAPTRGFSLQVNRTMSPTSGGTTAVGVISAGPIQATGLTSTRYFQSTATVGAGAATGQVLHFYAAQGTFSSTATEQTGFNAGTTLTGATNNYGFRGQINASTGRWNLYMDGTANNYLSGNLGIGFLTPTDKLVVQGNAVFRGDSTGAKFSNDTYGGGRVYLVMDGKASNGIGVGGDYLMVERYTNSDAFIRNSGSLSLITTGTEDITLTANGNSTTFKSNGQIGIGTTTIPTDYKMAIAGNVIAEKVKVKKQSSGWPDYVFSPEYKLPSLEEVEQFTKKNSHLPEIPSAKEIEKDGQDLGEMNRLLLKKVEELTLYVIDLKKEVKKQNEEIEKLKNK